MNTQDLEKQVKFRPSLWERLPSRDSAKPMIGLRPMSRPGDRSHKGYGRLTRLGGLGQRPVRFPVRSRQSGRNVDGIGGFMKVALALAIGAAAGFAFSWVSQVAGSS